MPGFRHFLTCVGEAVCAHGLKALAGLVPLGAVLYDIAEQVCHKLREAKQDDQLHQLLAAARADPLVLQAEANAVAASVASDQSPQLQHKLATYLVQVPALVRQSFRRPSDPAGRSVPRQFALRQVEDVLALLPARLPRFGIGDRPPGMADWELCELLGLGGFGEVWKARHRFFDGIAPVALKFCIDPQAQERLLKHEASILNQVMRHGRHPGIVPLLDASLSSDPPCLKYEYIEGGDLTGLIRDWPDTAEPRWRVATELVHQIAEIIAFAHRLTPAIVHRDLKPANVLLSEPRPLGRVGVALPVANAPGSGCLAIRITDFGIGGVVAQQAITQARLGTTLRGAHTPVYASPQQIRGEPPNPRDDVHALGVIWYQLLTGDLHNGPPAGMWGDDLEEHGVPSDLIRLLGSCIARPDKRPADAGHLAEQMTALLRPTKPVAVHDERLEQFLRTGKSGTLFGMLDLTNKPIGDAGALALAASPKLANLSVLILSGCQLTDAGVQALAASPHILNLTRLDLWDNHIGDAGVKALAESQYLENLGHLDLGRNRIGDDGIKALAASPYLRHLGELLLVSNHIGDEGALALAQSPNLANLAWLKPLDNRISSKGADALKQAFGKRVRIM